MAKNPSDKNNAVHPAGSREAMSKVQNSIQKERDASFRQHENDLERLDNMANKNFDRPTKG